MSVLPARLPAFTRSLLARQLALVKDAFLVRYPHPWLVWEPGASSVARPGVDVSVADTQQPLGAPQPITPAGGDAVCFALKLAPGAAVRVGRAMDNELVVPELTVSRLHARLELTGAGFSLVSLSETKATRVRGVEVPRAAMVPLHPGDAVELGGVRLAFHDATSFRDWLAAARPAS